MPLRTPLVPPPTAVNAGPRRTRRATRRPRLATLLGALACASTAAADTGDTGRTWLAGDHHVHSEWSVTWNREVTPPAPIRGGDSRHTITDNARRAAEFGLSWMVSTDRGPGMRG